MNAPEHQLYDYHYESDDPYVYPGTNVLINKFGFTNLEKLNQAERLLTGVVTSRLEITPIPGNFDLAHLQAIHKALFKEIYS